MSKSYSDWLETVKGHLLLVVNDKDCQLSSRIDCECPDKIQFKKPFASVDWETTRAKN